MTESDSRNRNDGKLSNEINIFRKEFNFKCTIWKSLLCVCESVSNVTKSKINTSKIASQAHIVREKEENPDRKSQIEHTEMLK